MKGKKLVVLVCALVLLLSVTGFNNEAGAEGEKAAEVGDRTLYMDEFKNQVEEMKSMYEQRGMDLDTGENREMLEQVEKQVLEQMIEKAAVLQAAEKDDIVAGEEEINNRIEEMKSQFQDEEQFKNALEQNGFTEEDLKTELSEMLTIQEFFDQKISEEEISVSDDEAREYYNQVNERFGEKTGNFEEIKTEIKEMLKQEKFQEAQADLVEELKNEAGVERFIE